MSATVQVCGGYDGMPLPSMLTSFPFLKATPLHPPSNDTLWVHSHGDLYDRHPAVAWLYPWNSEYDMNVCAARQFMISTWPAILCLIGAYLAMVAVGPRVMANREGFRLKQLLIWWNGALALFSIIGSLRTVPHLISNIANHGWQYSVCAPPEIAFGHGTVGVWMFAFILSKVPELLDTVWLILRKRKVIFLHWFHHATVLAYCWHAYMTRAGSGLWFAGMNYTVHAIMFTYYMLAAQGKRPSWAPLVTTLQIVQMFVGMAVVAATAYIKWGTADSCAIEDSNLMAGAAMYSSYAFLFVQFAVRRYCMGGATKAKQA